MTQRGGWEDEKGEAACAEWGLTSVRQRRWDTRAEANNPIRQQADADLKQIADRLQLPFFYPSCLPCHLLARVLESHPTVVGQSSGESGTPARAITLQKPELHQILRENVF